MTAARPKETIGRAEQVTFSAPLDAKVHARIDSGARTSSVWVSVAEVEGDQLGVVFFGPGHPHYTGEKIYFSSYTQDIVTSSNGHRDRRYKIKLPVILKKRKIRASFTLADRSTQVYPVLIGRNVLRGKFIVDVTLGTPMHQEENRLLRRNRIELGQEEQTS